MLLIADLGLIFKFLKKSSKAYLPLDMRVKPHKKPVLRGSNKSLMATHGPTGNCFMQRVNIFGSIFAWE